VANSLNKVMLIGNLGRDAEHRFTPSNIEVTSFSIATTRGVKNKDGGWNNETTWVNVTAFSLSDYVKEALKKGKKLYVEGRLSIRDYTDKDGIKKHYTEVVAEKLIPLEAREQSSGEYSGNNTVPDTNAPDTASTDSDLPF